MMHGARHKRYLELLDTLQELETAAERQMRAYRFSKLPVMKQSADPATRQQIMEKLYTEVCASWRMLTDVRFKLLGLLPLASLAGGYGLFTLGNTGAAGQGVRLFRLAVGLFGLAVTIGIVIYEHRNDGLYNDLISRGRRIESEWGVDTGLFLGRRRARFITHSAATRTIYGSTLLLWVAVLLIPLLAS